jgi:hypothetical protein
VLDVEELQDSCCECYAAINAHFRRLIGWSPDLAVRDQRVGADSSFYYRSVSGT